MKANTLEIPSKTLISTFCFAGLLFNFIAAFYIILKNSTSTLVCTQNKRKSSLFLP